MHFTKFAAAILLGASPSWARIAARSEDKVQYHVPSGSNTTLVDDSYIVMFAKDHNLQDHYANTGVNVSSVAESFSHFRHLNGYRATIKNATLVHDVLRHDPGVTVVQHNSLHTHPSPSFKSRPASDFSFNEESSSQASSLRKRWQWVQRPADKNWAMVSGASNEQELRTVLDAGYGVNVYVVDSGVNANSQVDTDRLYWLGVDEPTEKSPYCPNNDAAADDTGHGSACASIIGGKDIGVAPSVNIISVKNFCSGLSSMDLTIQAFEDIAQREYDQAEREGATAGTIINFSQGWGPDVGTVPPAFQQALSAIKEKGAMLTAAAGNSDNDASRYIPQALDDVYVVGNHGQDGAKYSSSNWGTAIDIWAPGESVLSADKDGNPVYMTGTSFSAPFVVGVAAMIWSEEYNIVKRDVANVWERITQNALSDVANVPNGNTNLRLQTGANNPGREPNRPYAYFGGSLIYDQGNPMDVDDIPDGGDEMDIE